MNLRKILLLSSMALAAIAFAVPSMASAQNTTFTHNHEHLDAGEAIEQSFHGELGFAVTGVGEFHCEVTVTIETDGPATADVKKFQPTTETCVGTGGFANCELVGHTFNLPWEGHASTHHVLLTNGNEDIEIHNFYSEGCGVGPTSRTLFGDVTLEPTLNTQKTLTGFTIASSTNVDTSGFVAGTGHVGLHVPSTPTLGLT